MKKIVKFAEHARKCRAMAAQTNIEDHRKQLLIMAETWDRLVVDRTNQRKPDTDKPKRTDH